MAVGTARRLVGAIAALLAVVAVGTVGYRVWGLGWLDALYQAVTTVTTVGFREVEPFDGPAKVFTILLVLAGAGTVLYTLSVILEVVLEGHLTQLLGRRRMDRRIADVSGHVVVCGWGRVGRALQRRLTRTGLPIVAIDVDPDRFASSEVMSVVGDATNDDVLRSAGVERAATLVAALASDADNLFVALSGRALNPELFIVARARDDASTAKLLRAGADRVVNPQEIGGARMAELIAHPHVAAFLDVVTGPRTLEFRLEEIIVEPGSPVAGGRLDRLPGGAHVLAVGPGDGTFTTRPPAATVLGVGDVLIVAGTGRELAELMAAVTPVHRPR
jgi:voltage-gated potassium channel